ncbi:hypothetical protein M413DRAFT_448661 [Hebeloma cylindrosporum]|uniref:Uncharacterized protein n=1 Tax=Hebeloma cylindrosporum TaxID=76867 RepID=A0A0C3C0H0_HEBCY|nr:hypothetical protein M413DRAFT_448661 [Hebeloma cylindrosporum h7]
MNSYLESLSAAPFAAPPSIVLLRPVVQAEMAAHVMFKCSARPAEVSEYTVIYTRRPC